MSIADCSQEFINFYDRLLLFYLLRQTTHLPSKTNFSSGASRANCADSASLNVTNAILQVIIVDYCQLGAGVGRMIHCMIVQSLLGCIATFLK